MNTSCSRPAQYRRSHSRKPCGVSLTGRLRIRACRSRSRSSRATMSLRCGRSSAIAPFAPGLLRLVGAASVSTIAALGIRGESNSPTSDLRQREQVLHGVLQGCGWERRPRREQSFGGMRMNGHVRLNGRYRLQRPRCTSASAKRPHCRASHLGWCSSCCCSPCCSPRWCARRWQCGITTMPASSVACRWHLMRGNDGRRPAWPMCAGQASLLCCAGAGMPGFVSED